MLVPRKQRTFARGASGFALAVWFWAAIVAMPSTGVAQGRDDPAATQAAKLLSRAISIRTVNPPGNERELAEFLVQELRDGGLEARVIRTPSPDGTRSRAAAWGRLAGRGRKRPIVLLSHLDVVDADAEAWQRPPFSGEIEDGYVYGRGALDAKGVSIIQLLAMLELAKDRTALDRDVIFLATPDEESGGRQGAGYLVRSEADLLGGAEFVLTEGGSIRPGIDGSLPVWGVAIAEKSPCWLELTARGTAGHSSTPRRDAAVPRLVAALDRIRRLETPISVRPEVARQFRRLSEHASADDKLGYANLADALAEDTPFRRAFLRNPGFNALVRNTISITMLKGGQRTNMAPGIARAHLDIRLLPGERCLDFKDSIAATIADEEVEIDVLLAFSSRSSPDTTALFRAIETVAARRDPDAIVLPKVIAGFTDAHWFREIGIASYGFVPRQTGPNETRGVHGVDERISIENLLDGASTLVEILREL